MEPDIAPPVAEPAAAAVPPPVRKDRRILRGVLRWTAAVAVFAAVGSATAYGVTGMDRTDVPGLATRTDGRWTYPELTAPPLRPAAPARSHGPIRPHPLRGPAEARAARARGCRAGQAPARQGRLAGDGRVPQGVRGHLRTGRAPPAVRRLRTAPHRRSRLDHVRRHSHARLPAALRHRGRGGRAAQQPPRVVQRARLRRARDGPELSRREVPDGGRERRPVLLGLRRARAVRRRAGEAGVPRAGDVLAVVLQTRKGGAAAVPFQQTVALQSRLLG